MKLLERNSVRGLASQHMLFSDRNRLCMFRLCFRRHDVNMCSLTLFSYFLHRSCCLQALLEIKGMKQPIRRCLQGTTVPLCQWAQVWGVVNGFLETELFNMWLQALLLWLGFSGQNKEQSGQDFSQRLIPDQLTYYRLTLSNGKMHVNYLWTMTCT